MAKKASKKSSKSGADILKKVSNKYLVDAVGLTAAIWYTFFVFASFINSINQLFPPENSYHSLLLLALICVAYSTIARKKLDNWSAFILGVALTSGALWFLVDRFYIAPVFYGM
jgi:hypothetical protein